MTGPEPSYVLGLSAFYHDSAACLLADGEIVAAASEERFTRVKGDSSFPTHAVRYCLAEAGIGIGDVDHVGFYDKPLLKFERILETYLGVAPRGFRSFLMAGPLWIKDKLYQDRQIKEALGWDGPVLYAEHHESHAASAFFPSPFTEAAIVTMDGVGEWATASIGVGRGPDLTLLRELRWPDSLGLLYSAFTYYTGFKVNSGEYKVMGLAPYGEPKYVDRILDHLMDAPGRRVVHAGPALLQLSRGAHHDEPRLPRAVRGPASGARVEAHPERNGPRPVGPGRVRGSHAPDGADRVTARPVFQNLCLAGGVALNCVGNGRILREGPFERIWIQPAAGDAGGALGVAQLIWHRHLREASTAGALSRRDEGVVSRPVLHAGGDRRVPPKRRRLLFTVGPGPVARADRPSSWRTRRSSAGSTAGWNWGPDPSAPAAFWATREAPGCRPR